MNFFIDFEATQFTQEIISIGCVAENGKSFYSEVNCKGKVTPFITNLTGLTPEQISEAPSADFVFQKFYSWLYSVIDSTIPTFYVFGDNDDHYVKTNGDCGGWVLEFSLNSGDHSKAWYYDCFDEIWEEHE